MARGIALSTAGVKVWYAVEATAETRPSTGYTQIPDIKEVPDFNPEPEAIDATDLEETEYKFSVAGLKDLGGTMGFLANFTEKLQTEWEGIVEDFNEAASSGKRMWFQVTHPKLAKAVFFPGEPASMGLPSMGVNGVMETTVYITPVAGPKWETKAEN